MNASRNLSKSMLDFATLMAIGALLACSVTVDSEGGTQSAALIDRLPAGATAIGWIDFEDLAASMTAEQWQAYEQMFEGDEDMQDLERFAEVTGIDLRQDMKQTALVVMPGDDEESDPIVLAHVLYEEDRIMELFANAATRTYQGRTLYAANEVFRELEGALGQDEEAEEGLDEAESPEGEPEDDSAGAPAIEREGYLVLLDDRTIALGSEPGLQIVVDVEDGRREGLKADPAMNDLISDVAGQGQIWLVATRESWDDEIGDLGAGGAMVPTNAIESIEVVTMSMRMNEGMAMRLAGITASAADAELLADALSGWTAIGKMALQGSQPELFEILDRGLRVGNEDRSVHIEATLTQADLDVLRRLAEEQMEAGEVIGSGS